MYPHPLPITETSVLSFSFENQTSWAHGVWLSVGNKELQLTVTQGCALQCTPVPPLPVASSLPGFAYCGKLPGPWSHLILEFPRPIGSAGHLGPSLSSCGN